MNFSAQGYVRKTLKPETVSPSGGISQTMISIYILDIFQSYSKYYISDKFFLIIVADHVILIKADIFDVNCFVSDDMGPLSSLCLLLCL